MAKKSQKKPKLLKPGQSIAKTVVIDNWDSYYDLRSDTFYLTVHWGAYGYRQAVPASSIAPLIELFESVERDGGSVYFNGTSGRRQLYFGQIPADEP